MDVITSRQNAVVKRFRALARTAPGIGGEILLDGEHLLQEALASAIPIEVAAFSQVHFDQSPRLSDLAHRVASAGGRVVRAPGDVFTAMTPVRAPSGVVAIARTAAADLALAFSGTMPLVVVLAGVQDPGNVGVIIRSAAAFGATAVIATEGSANPYGWKALRGAMGGTFRVPVVAGAAVDDVLTTARETRMPVVATVPRGGTPLPDARFRRACAVVLGSEGTGLPDSVIVAADVTVSIPIAGPVDSLNVATAAAIVLYEASRQRTDRH